MCAIWWYFEYINMIFWSININVDLFFPSLTFCLHRLLEFDSTESEGPFLLSGFLDPPEGPAAVLLQVVLRPFALVRGQVKLCTRKNKQIH